MSESDHVRRMLDAIQFYEIARQEAKRTILCEPHLEHAIRAAIDQLDGASVFTVQASPACPPGKLIILDPQALAAAEREFIQGLSRQPLFPRDANDPAVRNDYLHRWGPLSPYRPPGPFGLGPGPVSS